MSSLFQLQNLQFSFIHYSRCSKQWETANANTISCINQHSPTLVTWSSVSDVRFIPVSFTFYILDIRYLVFVLNHFPLVLFLCGEPYCLNLSNLWPGGGLTSPHLPAGGACGRNYLGASKIQIGSTPSAGV